MNARRPLACACLALALLSACGDDEPDDVRRNLAILSELPQPPGAHKLDTTSAPYYDEDGDGPVGHTTTIVYGVSSGTDAEQVIGFYATKLRPRWRCRREQTGAPLLHCTRGSALVSVNTENMSSAEPRFEVVADHEGAIHMQRQSFDFREKAPAARPIGPRSALVDDAFEASIAWRRKQTGGRVHVREQVGASCETHRTSARAPG
jgi:hypothetical protein